MSWPTPTMKNKKNGVANMGNKQEMESSWLRWLLSDDCHRSCKLCHVIAVWWHWQSLSATSEATDNQIWFCFMLFYVSFNRLTIKFLDHCKTIWYDYNNQYEIFWWQTPAAFPIQSCSNEMKPHRRLKNTKLRKYPSWLILPVNCMYPLAQRLFVLLCAIDWYYTVCSIQWYWCMQCKCWPAMISCFGALNRFFRFHFRSLRSTHHLHFGTWPPPVLAKNASQLMVLASCGRIPQIPPMDCATPK